MQGVGINFSETHYFWCVGIALFTLKTESENVQTSLDLPTGNTNKNGILRPSSFTVLSMEFPAILF